MPNKQSATKVLKSMGNARRRNSIKKQDQTRSNNTKSHGNPSGNGNKKFGDQINTNNAATGFTGAEEKNEMKKLSKGIVAKYGQFSDSPSVPNKENMDVPNENVIQNEKLQEEKLKLLGEDIDKESNFDELEFEALWQKEVVGTLSAASNALEKISKMSKKSKKSKRNKKENKDESFEITDVSEEKTKSVQKNKSVKVIKNGSYIKEE